MKIVVDTNIIFSALLNSNSAIAKILINSYSQFEFYSCNYMRHEIQKHWEKLKKISKLSDQQLNESWFYLFETVHFINEELIPQQVWEEALVLTQDVDVDDINFVALTIFLNAHLWTGDKQLLNGLRGKEFKNAVTTSDLLTLI